VSDIAWDGPGPPEHPVFPITKSLTSRAICIGSTVSVGDVAADGDYLMALSTTRSEIIVPVLDKARSLVAGTIDVESEQPHAFDAGTQQLLERCADLLEEFWTDCRR
jgi:putative methionine-R-sulfoxide reductase with GAF domain